MHKLEARNTSTHKNPTHKSPIKGSLCVRHAWWRLVCSIYLSCASRG